MKVINCHIKIKIKKGSKTIPERIEMRVEMYIRLE